VADTVQEAIEQTAKAGVESVSVDGQTAKAIPLAQLLEADRYLAGKTALTGTNANGGPRSGWGMLRPAKVVPPGMQ
jgi:hypothetical protein